VEVETERVFFRHLAPAVRERSSVRLKKTKENRKLLAYCFNDKHLTLGDMAFLLQVSVSEDNWQKDEVLQMLSTHLSALPGFASIPSLLTTENVAIYRNSAAHDSAYTLAKAKTAAVWCYDILQRIHSWNEIDQAFDNDAPTAIHEC
jgi:hypothetical protein